MNMRPIIAFVMLLALSGCSSSLHSDASKLRTGMNKIQVQQIFKRCEEVGHSGAGMQVISPKDLTVCYQTNVQSSTLIIYGSDRYHDWEMYRIYFDTNDVIVGYIHSPGEK